MRIILHTGKGGVGKTSLSAATGAELARRGRRTLVMSLDRAHSLSDSFALPRRLVDHAKGRPVEVADNLWIQEIDILEEVARHWDELHAYMAELLAVTGVDDFLAEEVAILPGMEETSCLLYINEYLKKGAYDVLLLDCTPTGESLRFVSFPGILRWYMERLFNVERKLVRVARPFFERLTNIPLPEEKAFDNVENLFARLDGIDKVLLDPEVTTVRLVMTPERMVIQESMRAYAYFCLYGMTVDAVMVNRVLPDEARGEFLDPWRAAQLEGLKKVEEVFAPTPIWKIPLQDGELGGLEGLGQVGRALYGRRNPERVHARTPPVKFRKRKGKVVASLRLPFVDAEDIDVTRIEETLMVRVGSFQRHVILPRTVPMDAPIAAQRNQQDLEITFG